MDYQFFTYIVSSESAALYVGMTNNLIRRIEEHKQELLEGFSKKYGCKKLVYFENTKYVYNAIEREKEIKGWRREKKVKLIESVNPEWRESSMMNYGNIRNRFLVPRNDKKSTEK